MQVKDVIAEYELAMKADDRAAARATLEALEGEAFRNESDWALIRDFLQKEGFAGRLELVTNGLIRAGAVTTGQPYFVLAGLFVKSRRVELAKPLIEKYKSYAPPPVATGWDQPRWEFAILLFEAGLYQDCLDELRSMIEALPEECHYRILEARATGKLPNVRLALKKMKQVKPLLGRNAGYWHTYAAAAFELGDLSLAQAATEMLIKLLESGEGRLNWGMSHLLKKNGYAAQLSRLMQTADPKIYKGILELTFMFDMSQETGAKQTATRFGNAILALNPEDKLRLRVERFLSEPGFLMA